MFDDEDEDALDIWDEESEDAGDLVRALPVDEDDDDDEREDELDDDDDDDEEDDEPEDDEDEGDEPETSSEAASSGRPSSVTVAEGDCLHRIAARYGLSVDKLWNAPDNAHLHEDRTRTQLTPGDTVAIPAPELKTLRIQTSKRHEIKITHRPRCHLRLRLLTRGEPRSGLDFTVEVDGNRIEGTTDGDGRVEVEVPARATRATLVLHAETGDERYPLRIGSLRPPSEVAGVQARLNRMGFRCGANDGDAGPRTAAAARAYRRASERGESAEDIADIDRVTGELA